MGGEGYNNLGPDLAARRFTEAKLIFSKSKAIWTAFFIDGMHPAEINIANNNYSIRI